MEIYDIILKAAYAFAYYLAWAKANVWQVVLWWWGTMVVTATAASLVVMARIKS